MVDGQQQIIPGTENRPDYRILKKDTAAPLTQPPDIDPERARQEAERRLSEQAATNPFTQFIQLLLGILNVNGGKRLPQQSPVGKFDPHFVFETPENQTTLFCNQITPTSDISDQNSYLFITAEDAPENGPRANFRKYRAFIVPKNDPAKRYEIPLTDAVLDTDKKEFSAKLGGSHSYVWSPGRATLDNVPIGNFERNSMKGHNLIAEPIPMSLGSNDDACWGIGWNGRSWHFVMKDLHTGVIQEFTQTPGTNRGTLRVIQGDVVTTTGYNDTGKTLAKREEFYQDGEMDRGCPEFRWRLSDGSLTRFG